MPARQTWPALSYWYVAVSTARSRSASAKTRNGLFPPSSNETGVRFAAAARAISRAVSTEPVKEIRARPGCATSAAPASSPIPWTTFRTPGGRPASRAISPRSDAVSGDHSAGLRTAVQPAASAGPTFQVSSMSGAFQGEMSAATPDGSRRTA